MDPVESYIRSLLLATGTITFNDVDARAPGIAAEVRALVLTNPDLLPEHEWYGIFGEAMTHLEKCRRCGKEQAFVSGKLASPEPGPCKPPPHQSDVQPAHVCIGFQPNPAECDACKLAAFEEPHPNEVPTCQFATWAVAGDCSNPCANGTLFCIEHLEQRESERREYEKRTQEVTPSSVAVSLAFRKRLQSILGIEQPITDDDLLEAIRGRISDRAIPTKPEDTSYFRGHEDGWKGAIEHVTEWLREVHPLQPIGDLRDEVGFTKCDGLARLIEDISRVPSAPQGRSNHSMLVLALLDAASAVVNGRIPAVSAELEGSTWKHSRISDSLTDKLRAAVIAVDPAGVKNPSPDSNIE